VIEHTDDDHDVVRRLVRDVLDSPNQHLDTCHVTAALARDPGTRQRRLEGVDNATLTKGIISR
jgi:hypothetical protein